MSMFIQTGVPLQPFGRNHTCPKCGCALIETRYDSQHDVMVRKCPCGYTWREATLDSAYRKREAESDQETK